MKKESSFIYDPQDEKSYADIMDKVPFYEWAKAHVSFENEAFLMDLALNIASFGKQASTLFLSIVEGAPNYSRAVADSIWHQAEKKIIKGGKSTSYVKLAQYGFAFYDGAGPKSPADEVFALKREYDMQLRGFFKDDKGKYQFNANIFVQYALTRFHLVRLVSNTYYIYDRSGYWKEIDEKQLGKVLRDIMHEAQPNIWKRKYQAEYLEALSLEVEHLEELDLHDEYLNLENGMLNLDTFEFCSHDPLFYSSIRIPIVFDPEAKCPKFEAFLKQVFQGDTERIANVQEAMGDGLENKNRTQKAYFLYGTGSNGKSVLAEVLTHLYGKQNVASVPLDKLDTRFGFQNLPGKIANISTENELRAFDTQNFKAITGGDFVEVEQKYKTAFSLKLICTLFILTNQLPPTKDTSYGYIRRIRAIPFDVKFKHQEESSESSSENNVQVANRNLVNELLEELEGILIFALEGLKRLKENNYELTSSKACDALLDRYIKVINPTVEFYEDCVRVNSNVSTKQPDFHKAFVKWAYEKGNSDWSRISSQKFWIQFRPVLANNGVEWNTKKIQGNEYLNGIELRPSEVSDASDDDIIHF